jgi:hypothetical protein
MQGGWSCCFPQLTAVLSFTCNCLASSTPSEVGQFNSNVALWFRRAALQFTTCPALEMAHCCVCSLRAQHLEFSSLPHPLSLGQVQHVTHPPLLSMFDYSLLLFFSFVGQFGFGCCSLA